MPSIIKYRKYCKACEDFNLFRNSKKAFRCEVCESEYESVELDSIDEVKIVQQQNRYKRSQREFLFERFNKNKNLLDDLLTQEVGEITIVEDDAGYIEKQRIALEQYNKERKERIAKQEKFTNVGRNDLCLCGSGKKYKKCCLNDVERIF